MATPRELAEITARRVSEQFAATGTLPPELIRSVQAQAWAKGRPISTDEVERQIREWVNARLEANDKKAAG